MNNVFVPLVGQYSNIGDIILRRPLARWIQNCGRLHVYTGNAPDGYIEGLQLDAVVSIEVGNEEIVERLSQRMVCQECGYVVRGSGEGGECPSCGGRLVRRKDDEPETIRRRLEVYDKQTRSLIRYYESKDLLRVVDGIGVMNEVSARIRVALGLSPEK